MVIDVNILSKLNGLYTLSAVKTSHHMICARLTACEPISGHVP